MNPSNKLTKQLEQEQNHRSGDHMEGYHMEGGKVQGISIIGRYKIVSQKFRTVQEVEKPKNLYA